MIGIIDSIRTEMQSVFAELLNWCAKDDALLNYKPPQGWTIKDILEHITLTNHYLLIIIKKGTRKAVEAARTTVVPANYIFEWDRMDAIGKHRSFAWTRPEHMEPTGNVPANDIADKLLFQLNDCLDCLNTLKNGEGALYKVTMSVNDLGKIDMYHYIYFLVQHAKRHITQMENIVNGPVA